MYRHILALSLALPLAAANPPADALNRFAGGLYEKLPREGNLVFSPLSVWTALGMTLTGARGQTAQEMNAVLRGAPDADFLDQLARGDQLALAQSLWVDRGLTLLPDFVRESEQRFRAAPNPADFAHSAEAARNAINQWAAQKTRGKITDLFPPNSIDAATRLVLASAVYFNGKWQSKFDTKSTTPSSFRTPAGTSVQTPFMNQTSRFAYTENESAQILEMTYTGGALVFDIVLPKANVPLSAIEARFGAGVVPGWFGGMHHREVAVSMPKIHGTSALSLKPALASMGMPSAFSDTADFSGIAGGRNLAIAQVAHKAFIDVDEEGTEAAAATGVGVSLTAYAPPVSFRADHPFLYFIRHAATGAIVFAGRVENPAR
jgi:serpin B